MTNRGATWTRLGDVPDGSWPRGLRSDDSGTILFVEQDERLARSSDGGATWHALPVAWPRHSLSTFAIDSHQPDVVYVGTSAGPYVSQDGGRTWQLRAHGITRAAAHSVIHEGPRTTVFARVGAEAFKSGDDGATWSKVRDDVFPAAIDARSLASDGAGGVLLRAGSKMFRLNAGTDTWADDRVPGDTDTTAAQTPHLGMRLAWAKSHFYYSRDGGTAWQTGSLPSGVTPSAVVPVASDSRHLMAAVGGLQAFVGGRRNSFWRSRDAGETWTLAFTPSVYMGARCCSLISDPNDSQTLYAVMTGMVVGGGGAELLRSIDGGITWTAAGSFDSAVAVVPTTVTTLLAQEYQRGVVRSVDGGRTWTPSGLGLPTGVDVTAFTFDRRRPSVIFAATSNRGVYRSDDGGSRWAPAGLETRPEMEDGKTGLEDDRMRACLRLRIVLGLAVLALVSGCQGSGSTSTPAPAPREASLDDPGVRTALAAIKADLIRQHMSVLADDALEGRGLGTAGLRGRAAATSRRR